MDAKLPIRFELPAEDRPTPDDLSRMQIESDLHWAWKLACDHVAPQAGAMEACGMLASSIIDALNRERVARNENGPHAV